MKITRDTLQWALLRSHNGLTEKMAEINFKEYMRDQSRGWMQTSHTIVGCPQNLSNVVLFWLCDSLSKNKKVTKVSNNVTNLEPNTTSKMLLDFIDLYADILLEDDEVQLRFVLPDDDQERNVFVKTVDALYKVFEQKYANEIKDFKVKQVQTQTELLDYFDKQSNKKQEDETV